MFKINNRAAESMGVVYTEKEKLLLLENPYVLKPEDIKSQFIHLK